MSDRKKKATQSTADRPRSTLQTSAEASVSSRAPLGAIAVYLLERWQMARSGGLVFIAATEKRAEQLAAILAVFDPRSEPMVLPRSDAMPQSGTTPSREVMGRRASVLRRMAQNSRPLVLATPDATLQRVVPAKLWQGATLRLDRGAPCSLEKIHDFLERTGYAFEARVDGPCEASVQGAMVDVFPGGALGPVRIEISDDRIAALHTYDAVTLRTSDAVDGVVLDAASEHLWQLSQPESEAAAREAPNLVSVFSYLSEPNIVFDNGVDARAVAFMDQIKEAFESGNAVRRLLPSAPQTATAGHCMELNEWRQEVHAPGTTALTDAEVPKEAAVPKFATQHQIGRALREFVERQTTAGHRILLTAATERDLRRIARGLGERQRNIQQASSWEALSAMAAGTLAAMRVDLDAGFVLPASRITVIAAADVLGSQAGHVRPFGQQARQAGSFAIGLKRDDLVVHLQRGLARLIGLENVAGSETDAAERVKLAFQDGSALVGVDELAVTWRYGSGESGIKLDQIDSNSWAKRRAELDAEIAATAANLVEAVKERRRRTAERLIPPPAEYERFAARFQFFPTPDQAQAIQDVVEDLASGRPMDRLICGDVGYGKTEVALRAAAAAALAGKQVALAVPTTVLARQHFETLQRRFAGFGIAIGYLGRTASASETRKVRAGLADGTIRIVVGTQAVVSKGVRFKELGLVIIDEEQRFGARDKTRFREMAKELHVLTLTATPIPRTLQLGLAGLRDLSVIASPPARRLPVRTLRLPFQPEAVRTALFYEQRRGGRSFVVCPRIEDIDGMRKQLETIVPELSLVATHGKMPAADIDDAMLAFAAGEKDVLLATNIIESGLDLPQANTIMIWHAERFGLAQLHQLRGRVGRGTRQGFAYLLTDADAATTELSERRLRALTELSNLGAGFAISEHDLDLRGAGDLFGEQQAGHVKLVGAELYRHLLDRAVRRARGEAIAEDYTPQLNIGISGGVPSSYVADPDTRLEIFARLAKAPDEDAIDDIEDEIEDRFGPLPEEVRHLLGLARLRQACIAAGVSHVDAGPKAVALEFRSGRPRIEDERFRDVALSWKDGRLILAQPSEAENRIRTVSQFLARLNP